MTSLTLVWHHSPLWPIRSPPPRSPPPPLPPGRPRWRRRPRCRQRRWPARSSSGRLDDRKQETGNRSAPLSWLMHHNSNISVLTDFFLWDWNVCWHTVWSPVLTLVTTPSIVLFPGKEERNVETFTAFNQRLKLSFMSHQNICWDVDESSPRHVMNSVMSNMLNRNSREVLRRWFCSVDRVTLVSPSCMFWSRCIVTF